MRSNHFKQVFKTAVLAIAVLLLGASVAGAQVTVNLTAGSTTLTLPDGSTVPMWGYTCGATDTKCAKLNPTAATWSPVVITVPTGQSLTINLTNQLPAPVKETSIVIVGQLGGGLGNVAQRTTTNSPDHSGAQSTSTWPIVGANPDTGTPPAQSPRVSSFSTPALNGGTAAQLVWSSLNPGTYLIESGTHPSIQATMGLYGILVVTQAPASGSRGVAYGSGATAVNYDSEVPLLFSEIDPVQNTAVNAAVNTPGFSETMVWSGQPGGCGNPSSATFNQCYPPAVNYKPLYYLINGVAFNKTNASGSLFAAVPGSSTAAVSGSVLVRLVNAGLRMHIPSIVGSQTTPSVVASGTTPTTAAGFSLVAEDGNPLPGVSRIQSEVFMAAGKTYDVMINVPAASGSALPIFDRELSLSGNSIERDAGMLAYIGINGSSVPSNVGALSAAVARADIYNALVSGQPLTVSDPSKGVLANDTNVFGVQLDTAHPAANGTVVLNADGTFTYTPTGTGTADSFGYCGNGTTQASATPVCATVSLAASNIVDSGVTCTSTTFNASTNALLSVGTPGVLAGCTDGANLPLSVVPSSITASGITVTANQNGGFTAIPSAAGAGTYTFTFVAQNSQGTKSAATTVTVSFPAGNGPTVTVYDGVDKKTVIGDYRWIIEEDRTFYVDPNCTTNPPPASCPTATIAGQGVTGIVPTFGTNFHTSYMPVIATGCTGALSCETGQTVLGSPVVCDSNGICRAGTAQTAVLPNQVQLDPTKRYYISVLPGDAANPFNNGGGAPVPINPSDPNSPLRQFDLSKDCTPGDPANNPCGHGMGGAPIAPAQATVTIYTQPTPFPPAKLSVFVFEDDFPLNGEQDAGGGIDVLASNEPGLGSFNITLFDDAGGTGDATGQMTYDMFNMPLSNSLAGTRDPATGQDACPISKTALVGSDGKTASATGITGTIVTCPRFEADGRTLSPLAGQAVVANLMPGRYGVVATPAADRIAKGEEWLQTNTLDGQKAHDSFLRIGEPSFFQEFGPAGYHVSIGFANPQIINARHAHVCNGTDANLQASDCTHTVKGSVSTERMSRTPDERLYGSGSYDSFSFTQCYVSLGDTDGEDFAFTKCNSDGTWQLTNIPPGTWRVTVFDQWNDMLVDGLSTPVDVATSGDTNLGPIAMNQWQANIYTSTFFDQNGNGVRDGNEPGLTLVPTNIRFRDGSYSNFNNTDLNGNAGFNEVFPLFSWYVIETDDTRYKNTGTHVVYDAGGPADGTSGGGNSSIAQFMANTLAAIPVPTNLRVPGAFYCATADCGDAPSPVAAGGAGGSTGRVDPAWVTAEGWQGFSGQNSFLEFGKTPFAVGENGGIHGHVVYASTRPFDDPVLLLQTSWEPLVPNVTINLYEEGVASDGITQTLKLVDTTLTSSWDAWAQGFRSDGVPNMNCPGQGRDTGTNADLFFFTLYNQPNWLDFYNNQHGGAAINALPANAQFKCYDGMHNWNQLQPAQYDGRYQFPSVTGRNPSTGAVAGTHCSVCIPNPTDGTPMLPSAGMKGADGAVSTGKYVVEVVVPPNYELVKEEDKNILIGDNYIAPVTQQFAGLGDIFILPDQAEVAELYNANNGQNDTNTLGRTTLPSHEGDTGSIESFWPCVGQMRTVPDYISLYPGSGEVSPFAGATRPLCDRKEVTLTDQTAALAKFYVFTSTHAAAHFTGVITDDFTSEFDPFAPQYGEKFSPPNLPIAIKDWSGQEISRVYTDQWGTYNGLTYSTWEVNPPNPTGYAPTMMVTCMNDPGTGATPDPLFNPEYSQFCYEIPFMPGQTQYMDTPVVPTSAFAGAGYNNPDCAYPALTPAIASVVSSDIAGPWVSASGVNHTLTITALGDQTVPNNSYSGPSATTAPFNQKTVTRHYGFGAAAGKVTIGGVTAPLAGGGWSDTSITVSVPSGVPQCAVQQQSQYGNSGPNSTERCGELIITTASGQQSIDTVTVTIGGKTPAPPVLPITNPVTSSPFGAIQTAINAAAPGDLILISPGVYNEMLLMWKPVRLQGVGAASVVINANSQPAGRMTPWRSAVTCLFGLALNGQPYSTPGHLVPEPGGVGGVGANGNPNGHGFEPLNVYDPTGGQSCPATGWNYFTGGPNNPQVDRIPLEGILGWDVSLNGNLAELLQEPTLMGAYEGAGITVLGKGVRYPAGVEVFGAGQDNTAGSNIAHAGQMPLGTLLLTNSTNDCNTTTGRKTGYSSNFNCNPSRIDGLSVTDSSQGGGGIYVHGWAHNLEIANDRVYNNTGTLTGGITVGQGESPDALLSGNGGDPLDLDQQPWTCVSGAVTGTTQNAAPPGFPPNTQLPFCYNTNVNVHHNAVTRNSSVGDELFSSTPAGAGGVTFCNGSDYYMFNYNWVCGNLSTGDGGGFAHLGFSYQGDIEHNAFLFNQSTNPTVPTNGGGLIIMGAAPDGTLPGAPVGSECGSVTDVDCAPGLTDGTGPGLTINANLIMGNSADSGSGGGLRLQDVDGTNIGFFPNGNATFTPRGGSALSQWHHVLVTNNIIANNVAGWDGAGISLQDALDVDIVNNTIISNDTTASSGVLFNALGASEASAPGSNCIQPGGTAQSCPQPAGLVTMQNTSLLHQSLNGVTVTCPSNHGTGGTGAGGRTNGQCKSFSVPNLANNVIWQNRAFVIGVGALGSGTLNQQNVVSLFNANFTSLSTSPAATQPTTDASTNQGGGVLITGGTGACTTPVSFWDIGVRGDSGPANHGSGLTPTPTYTVLTDASDYGPLATTHNSAGAPDFASQYCNGSRTPPEFKSLGYQVPPGISDATVPNPVFNLTPAATVDEGNNWINISWGPLALTNTSNGSANGSMLGSYSPTTGSSVINLIPNTATTYGEAPSLDFFGNPRKTDNRVDAGAVEFVPAPGNAVLTVTPTSLTFPSTVDGTTSSAQTLTLANSGTGAANTIALTFSGPFSRATGGAAGSCGATLAANTNCTIGVVFSPTTTGTITGSVNITANVAVANSPVNLSGTGAAAVVAATLTPTSHDFGTHARTCPGTTILQILACTLEPVQTFTLRNTGNVNLTAVTAGTLGGANPTEFAIVLSTCGGTVAPAGTCSVTVQFKPQTGLTAGSKSATLTVGYTGGSQTSTLTGTANP